MEENNNGYTSGRGMNISMPGIRNTGIVLGLVGAMGLALGGCTTRSPEEKGFADVDISQVYGVTGSGEKLNYIETVGHSFEPTLWTNNPNPHTIRLGEIGGEGRAILERFDRDVRYDDSGLPTGEIGDGRLDQQELNSAYATLTMEGVSGKQIVGVGYNPVVSGLGLNLSQQIGVLNAFYSMQNSNAQAAIASIQDAVAQAANDGGDGDNNAANSNNSNSSTSDGPTGDD